MGSIREFSNVDRLGKLHYYQHPGHTGRSFVASRREANQLLERFFDRAIITGGVLTGPTGRRK
jgi:hypothetical protein